MPIRCGQLRPAAYDVLAMAHQTKYSAQKKRALADSTPACATSSHVSKHRIHAALRGAVEGGVRGGDVALYPMQRGRPSLAVAPVQLKVSARMTGTYASVGFAAHMPLTPRRWPASAMYLQRTANSEQRRPRPEEGD